MVGMPRLSAERIGREHKGVDREIQADRYKRGLARALERLEHLDRERVERQPAFVVGLRAFEPALTAAHDVARPDPDEPTVEVEVRPPQGPPARHGGRRW
jgi:hypothetical protein